MSIVPTYNYYCPECVLTEERVHPIDSDDSYLCPECNWVMVKKFTAPAIHFKGGGWGGNHPGKAYKTTFDADAATGELGSVTTEETGPAVKPGETAQS